MAKQGWSGKAIPTALGVRQATVSGWLKTATATDVEARRRPPPGPPPPLTGAQRAALLALRAPGAADSGFGGDGGTTKWVVMALKRQWGSYHPAQRSGVLRQVGWRVQQPLERASHRKAVAPGWESRPPPWLPSPGGSGGVLFRDEAAC